MFKQKYPYRDGKVCILEFGCVSSSSAGSHKINSHVYIACTAQRHCTSHITLSHVQANKKIEPKGTQKAYQNTKNQNWNTLNGRIYRIHRKHHQQPMVRETENDREKRVKRRRRNAIENRNRFFFFLLFHPFFVSLLLKMHCRCRLAGTQFLVSTTWLSSSLQHRIFLHADVIVSVCVGICIPCLHVYVL